MSGGNLLRIEWQRLWEPVRTAGESAGLSLISPVNPTNRTERSALYQDLDHLSCLVLLGPPGSGKTTELQTAYQQATDAGQATSNVRLRSIPTIDDLRGSLQEGRTAWASGVAGWTIFMDGLDEAPVRGPEMQTWLLSVFRDIATQADDRLKIPKLRLTCRSADWPERFEEELAALWGTERTAVLQLTELTDDDVQLAVASWSADQQESFIATLHSKALWSLAKSPVTLAMLARIFDAFGGKLPSGLVATYRGALLALVEDRRRLTESRPAPEYLTPIELLRLLGRVAAVTMLSGRLVIWSGLYADPVPTDAVSVTDLAGGVEMGLPRPLPADERAFRQALRSAVFRSDGPNRFVWTHQSLVEFLAADYLAQTIADAERLLELVSVEEDGNRVVPPQLREVAAWLAGMHDEFRSLLVRIEPGLLLRSDVASADTEFKAALVNELLVRLSTQELLDTWRDPRVDYSRLNYPGLYGVLGPFVRDPQCDLVARRVAIHIVRDCVIAAAKDDLLHIATDENDDPHIRAAAIITLGTISDGNDLTRVKPLIRTDLATDPQDEIRGAALRVLWPRFLSEGELFEVLAAPRDNHLLGWYKAFIYELKFESPTIDGAISAVRWIEALPAHSDVQITFRTLIENVITGAWSRADDPGVLGAIAEMLCASARDYSGALRTIDLSNFVRKYQQSSHDLRRNLVIETAIKARSTEQALDAIIHGPWRLVVGEDLSWLLDDLASENPPIPERILLEAITVLMLGRDLEDVAFVWDYADRNARLAEVLNWLFTTNLDSPTARWAKQDHERKLEAVRELSTVPTRQAQLSELLTLCESDPSAWWRVNFVLLDGSSPIGYELTGVLTGSPGWIESDSEERYRIVRSAFRYLTEYSLDSLDWIGTNTIFRPATAGYRAFRLLYSRDISLLNAIPAEGWANWVGAILWFPNNDSNEERTIRGDIARIAHERAPQKFVEALVLVLSRDESPFDIAEIVEPSYDLEIGAILWNAVRASKLQRQARETLLRLLVSKRFEPALLWIQEGLTAAAADVQNSSQRDALTTYGPAIWFSTFPREVWSLLWPRRLSDPAHAHEIWLRIAENNFSNWTFLSELTPGQLGELYQWISDKYPEEQHRPLSGFVGPEDQLRMMRAQILGFLARSGSDEAVAVISRLRAELPSDPWLPGHLNEARETRRAASWSWLEPHEVLRRLGIDTVAYGSRAQSIIAALGAEASVRVPDIAIDATANLPEIGDPIEAVNTSAGSDARTKFRFLLVATEWRSFHGGVSTFNRDLAIELARRGHSVRCLVPEFQSQEDAAAVAAQVRLIAAPPLVGYSGRELLDACMSVPWDGEDPDFIIGHDHVTGRTALRIRNHFFKSSRYVHVLHTLPTESGQYNEEFSHGDAAMRAYGKRVEQVKLCQQADSIVAIGPKVDDEFRLSLSDRLGRMFSLIPGLNREYLALPARADGGAMEVLWIGRAEDAVLKGIPVVMQMAASMQHRRIDGVRSPIFVMRGVKNSDVEKSQRFAEVNRKSISWRPFSSDQDDILNDLRAASCLIMPSQTEAFGLVALEAIAMGIPVLVSSDSGIGTFLLKQKQLLDGICLVEETVLDVDDDPGRTAARWAPVLERCLATRATSLAQADALRRALIQVASWDVSLAALEIHLTKIVHSTSC